MDVSSIAGLSTAMSQTRTQDAIDVLVQKKAMDMQAESAVTLLQALPQPSSNPAHLGQNVDTRA